MDRRVVDVVARLLAIRASLGARAFRDAVQRARLGIAVAAHVEAERRAARRSRRLRPLRSAVVIRFPLARARPAPDGDDRSDIT
jgi:hypothetical protein